MTVEAVKDKNISLDIEEVQRRLQEEEIDAWLFYYFRDNDPLALRILGLTDEHFYSRRWLYLIPSQGVPVKIVHRIEENALDGVEGEPRVYVGWRELETVLSDVLKPFKKVAMQYSPRNHVPYVSRVDAGMIDLIRSFGVDVVTSANLIQRFEAVLSDGQLESHVFAAEKLRLLVDEAFGEIRRRVGAGEKLTEYDIQRFIMNGYERCGLITGSPPIVAVNRNSGSPHYQPTAEKHAEIKEGDFVLVDIWAKRKEPVDAVYADITWTGFVGEAVPGKHKEIFEIVKGARDAALAFVSAKVRDGAQVLGWQVDEAARSFISDKGYGKYFVHRTGHSIGLEVHANGANMDNLETREEREIIPRTLFSIEPGIYLAEFGVRSEIDAYVGEGEVLVFGQPIQTEIVPILK